MSPSEQVPSSVPPEQEPFHLVILQHGICGDHEKDLANISSKLQNHFPGKLHTVLSDANSGGALTFDGIKAGGERLANLIKQSFLRPGGAISFVCHSLGGIYARQALGVLEEEGWFETFQITAMNFVTLATPHLGIGEFSNSTSLTKPIELLSRLIPPGPWKKNWATIHSLALNSDTVPNLARGAPLRALKRFQRRAAYGNLIDDLFVRPCSALMLPRLPEFTDALEPGIPMELPVVEPAADQDLRSFPPKQHDTLRQMLGTLEEMEWEKYLVHFPKTKSSDAHNKICNHGALDPENHGHETVKHLCARFLVQHEL